MDANFNFDMDDNYMDNNKLEIPVECYSRPVNNFNPGQRAQFENRQNYNIEKIKKELYHHDVP